MRDFRVKIKLVDGAVLPEHEHILIDYHEFDDLISAADFKQRIEDHYKFRNKLFRNIQQLEITIEKWHPVQQMFVDGRWWPIDSN